MNENVLAYNDACRRVLCDKRILSYLLKITLKEYKNLSLKEIEPLIEGQIHVKVESHKVFPRQNEVVSEEGTIIYDLLFTSRLPKSNDYVDFVINVEVQRDPYPRSRDGIRYPILKRGIFYSCRAMVEEQGRIFNGNNYQDLKKVVSIWINTKPLQIRQNSMNTYEIQERHVGGKLYKENIEDYDLIEIVVMNLGEDDSFEKLGPLNELFVKRGSSEEIYQSLKEKYGIEVYEETRGKVKEMCDLGQGLVDENLAKGEIKGRKEEKINSVMALMETMNVSYDVAVSLLKFSEEDKIKYRDLVLESETKS